jgi:hypothetical protein
MFESRFDPGSSRNTIWGLCKNERIRLTLSLCQEEREDIFRERSHAISNLSVRILRFSREIEMPAKISKISKFSSTVRYSRNGPSTK